MPIDPGRDWLAAGITGLQRQREWDAVATSEADGTPGDEVAFVALADTTFVRESGAGDSRLVLGRVDKAFRHGPRLLKRDLAGTDQPGGTAAVGALLQLL